MFWADQIWATGQKASEKTANGKCLGGVYWVLWEHYTEKSANRAMFAKESNLLIALKKREDIDEPSVERMVSEIRQKRAMKILSIIQDLSDTFLALSDIRDGNGILSNPLLLSSCGLLSALISTHKNWLAC